MKVHFGHGERKQLVLESAKFLGATAISILRELAKKLSSRYFKIEGYFCKTFLDSVSSDVGSKKQ